MTDTITFINTSDQSDFHINLFIVSLGTLIISVLAFLKTCFNKLIHCHHFLVSWSVKQSWRNEVRFRALRCQRHMDFTSEAWNKYGGTDGAHTCPSSPEMATVNATLFFLAISIVIHQTPRKIELWGLCFTIILNKPKCLTMIFVSTL